MTENTSKTKLMEPYALPSYLTEFEQLIENAPKSKVKLFQCPSPLQSWNFTHNGLKYDFLIKRDDFLDFVSSGNKLRKLQFILPTILNEDYDCILSLGPVQSNCCSVITSIAPKFGLKSAHVLIQTSSSNSKTEGNLFFHNLFGSKIFQTTRDIFYKEGPEKMLENAKIELIATRFCKKPYIIPMGGVTITGVFGFYELFQEIEKQLEESNNLVEEIFFASGSGGAAAGLALGKYLAPYDSVLKHVKLTGFIVWDTSPKTFYNQINEIFQSFGLPPSSEDLITFIEAKGEGYGFNSPVELELIRNVATTSGIILDGTYTAKALMGFINSGRFKPDRKCVFIHTGGQLAMIGTDRFNFD